jgi:hypothetical protein
MLPPHVQRIRELEGTIKRLEEELRMSRLKEELALVVPQAYSSQKKRFGIERAKSAAGLPGRREKRNAGENPGPESRPP